jgi:hypothetical protein
MQIKQGPTIHQGQFVADIEQHRMWRYIVKRVGSGEVLYDGWSSELDDAVETADRQLSLLCESELGLAKAS